MLFLKWVNYYRGHISCLPPSIGSIAPVIKLASGLARKAIAFATSSGCPGLPSGWVVWHLFRNSSYCSKDIPPRLCSSVMITPGFTLLTRTCLGARSKAVQQVNWSKADFDMLYARRPLAARIPVPLDIFTMFPKSSAK